MGYPFDDYDPVDYYNQADLYEQQVSDLLTDSTFVEYDEDLYPHEDDVDDGPLY